MDETRAKALLMLLVGVCAVFGYYIESYFISSGQIKAMDSQSALIFGQVNGGMQAMAMAVIMWCFGSTKTSGDKDKSINDAIGKIPSSTQSATITQTETTTPDPSKKKETP